MEGVPAALVLVDASAPSMDHAGAIADLKLASSVAAPVYLFAAGEEDLRKQAERTGADGYVCTEWGFRRLISVVRWAVRQPRAEERQIEVSAQDLAARTMNRIVVLDDHAGARGRLVHELRNQGYAVEGCGDLPSFEAALASLDPDLVVADVVLEGITGDEVCRRLKDRMSGRLLPIVLISSLPEWELKQRAKRAGADAYFRKQDGLPKLVQLIEELLSEIIF